jgi:hypothetical protein|nr:MAG TPA: hypothetical protein [Caudoviricetes sp.]
MKKYTKYEQELIDNCGIYPSRYLAKKNAASDELFVVKVDGGYKAINYNMYKIWRNNK